MWLNGPISEVVAMTETFITEREHNLTGNVEPVGIDDASAFLCRFENGSLANFEATRYARGHKALYTLEINGEHASAIWDLHDLHRIQYFDHRDEGLTRGWRSVHVTDGDHRIRTHLHPPVRRFPRRAWRGQSSGADVQGRPGDGLCDRRGIEIGKNQAMGESLGRYSTARVSKRLFGVRHIVRHRKRPLAYARGAVHASFLSSRRRVL
jgi:hypothetical protein